MSIVNNFFDKVYVLSIKRLTKRQEHIKKHFKERNIEFEFVFGFDKDTLNMNEYNINKKKKLDSFQIANILSHKCVWEEILKNNYENCLICEDDVFLPDFFENKFSQFIKNLDNKWDILQFGWQPYKYIPKGNNINKYVRKNLSFIAGAHCYGINYKSCKELINFITWLKKKIVFLSW